MRHAIVIVSSLAAVLNREEGVLMPLTYHQAKGLRQRQLHIAFDGLDDLNQQCVLRRMKGEEGISRPFNYRLSFLTTDLDLDPMNLIGRGVTFGVATPFENKSNEQFMFRHGLVRNVGLGPILPRSVSDTPLRHYVVEVVPWFEFLTASRHRRMFEHKNLLEIFETVVSDYKSIPTDLEIAAAADRYRRYETRVQFDESDFQFLSRLLADEGIFYYFDHKKVDGQLTHQMVLCDKTNQYVTIQGSSSIGYRGDGPNKADGMAIDQWECNFDFQPLATIERDYDFTRRDPGQQAVHSQTDIHPELIPTEMARRQAGQFDAQVNFPEFSMHD